MNSLNGKPDAVEKAIKKATLWANILLISIIAFLSLLILAQAMTKELGPDEHMYCTAGYLTANGHQIYKDFSYVAQPPCHSFLLGTIYRLTGTSHYLLAARLVSAICDIGVLVCIAMTYRRIFKKYKFAAALLGIAAVVIYQMNWYVEYTSGFAWNHNLVLLLVAASLWIFINIDFEKVCFWRLIFLGALLTIATFTRATIILIWLVFLIAIIIRAKSKIKTTGIFLASSSVFAAWPIWSILKSPQAFWLNIFKIPVLNGKLVYDTRLVDPKAGLTVQVLLSPCYIVCFLIAVCLLIFVLKHKQHLIFKGKNNLLLCVTLILTSTVIAFIPATMWSQYWALPVLFIVVAFAYPLLWLREVPVIDKNFCDGFVINCAFIAISMFICIINYPPSNIINPIRAYMKPENWVPLQVHQASRDISNDISDNKPVLTLSPLYAIEGGMEIYPQFSAGPFVFRVAGKLSEEEKRIVNAISDKDLPAFIENNKPNVVIIGPKDKFAKPLVNLTKLGWLSSECRESGLEVYYLP